MGFPCGSAGKESACNAGDLGSVSGLGRSPGEGKGYPLQYSGLENSMECIIRGDWCFWTVLLDKTLESPLDCKEIQPVNPKGNQSWMFIGRTDAKAETPNTLATWWEELTHWKRPWCWERLQAGGKGNDRGWDGWHHWLNWTWVWVSSGSWWWTGRPGGLQVMGSQRLSDWTDWLTTWDARLFLLPSSYLAFSSLTVYVDFHYWS